MTASHASEPSEASSFSSVRRRLAAAGREARRLAGLFGRPGGPPPAARGSMVEPLEGRRLMSVTISLGGDGQADEGNEYEQPVTVTAPEGAMYDLTFDWGDGYVETIGGPVGDPWAHWYWYADGSETYTVTATIDAQWTEYVDGEEVTRTGSATDTLTVTVNNVDPTFELSGYSEATGGWYELSVNDFFDPGQDTVSQWQIDWGDGSSGTYLGSPGQFDHLYTENGTYNVTATATDEDGSYTRNITAEMKVTDVTIIEARSQQTGNTAFVMQAAGQWVVLIDGRNAAGDVDMTGSGDEVRLGNIIVPNLPAGVTLNISSQSVNTQGDLDLKQA